MLRSARLVRAVTALALLGLFVPLACSAPPPPSTPASRAAAGADVFRRYCASCHGVAAMGDGVVAASLRKPPADLTRIAARRGGSFDAPAIAAYVDGRERVAEHGAADMPVWGRRFDDRQDSLADETKLAPGDIYLVVEYLRSIQR
jgi:mono/diheme cytochrome c family protein